MSEAPGLWQRTVEESECLQRLDDDAAVEDVRPTADRHELVDDRPLLVAAQLFEEDHAAASDAKFDSSLLSSYPMSLIFHFVSFSGSFPGKL